MLIAAISDTHDNIWVLRKVIQRINELHVNLVIHCGDFCAPFVLKELSKLSAKVHGVFGYIDGDRYTMTKLSLTKLDNITLHGDMGEVELDGRKIAFVHEPRFARGLVATGDYDIVFYGHTHKKSIEKFGNKLLVNPGEIMGRKYKPSFALYDTKSGKVEIEEVT